ncbi:Rrf2 family transcriptional regulator [Lysobacter sp. F60174L2]|uniref:Rrf2 family transcriptional regulator n=1 Tax=Lysobacter sp. F60174L2 TaxID=3459295 RepID=UPI00403DEEB9
MRTDSRLSRMLHVLVHMDRHEQRATSESIGRMLETNAAVVRRTLAGLREQGIVKAERGPGGGWALARALSEITLLDVYQASGTTTLFTIGVADRTPDCLVEQSVNMRLESTLGEAEAAILARFAAIRLSDIAADFDQRLRAGGGWTHDL